MVRTSASLFTGGAIWDVGAMMAGLTPTWGIEIVPEVADVAERNIPGLSVIRSDVAVVDYSSLPKVYHLHASPSCKNASNAKKDAAEAMEDIDAARAICRALAAIQPVVFTLENVYAYRNFEAFRLVLGTLHELGYAFDYWHLNAADYAVPQTRKRLILIARRDGKPVTMPRPTHAENPPPQLDLFGGEFGLKRWVGWYEAIEDLIPELPDSEFAKWQLERLPEELRTMLVGVGGYDGAIVTSDSNKPTFTVTTTMSRQVVRALLVPGGNNNFPTPDGERRAFTITGSQAKSIRAFYADFQNATREYTARLANEPATTVVSTMMRRKSTTPAAFVVGSQYGQPNTVKDRPPQTWSGAEPYFSVTVSGGSHQDQRAFVGRIVKMTPRALARFQSIPDTYILPEQNGLACTIIGNGVPCLLAKAICEATNA